MRCSNDSGDVQMMVETLRMMVKTNETYVMMVETFMRRSNDGGDVQMVVKTNETFK